MVILIAGASHTGKTQGTSDEIDKSWEREILFWPKGSKMEESCMRPQEVCRIRKPACGCGIFPTFETARIGKNATQPQKI